MKVAQWEETPASPINMLAVSSFRRVYSMPTEVDDQGFRVTEDFPGFFVHDGRVTGSITLGPTRMPLWAVIEQLIDTGYDATAYDFPSLPTDASAGEIALFLRNLLEQRKDFGRLLCTLADVERQHREARSRESDGSTLPVTLQPWYADPHSRKRVRAALRSCLDKLDELETSPH